MLAQGLMDYSLLVGVKRQRFEVLKDRQDEEIMDPDHVAEPFNAVERLRTSEDPFQRRVDGGVLASIVEGPGIFYFGIIDVLHEWTLRKKLERYFKIYVRGFDGDGLSATDPETYAARYSPLNALAAI